MYFNKKYWEKQYQENKTGWDVGYLTPPIEKYIDQLTDKNITILTPGAGNAYEAEYLILKGFKNTYVLDFASMAIDNLLKRFPAFPSENIIIKDFFEHTGQYDLILEHTFFSSFPPSVRGNYVDKMYKLLKPKGKLVGLLFNREFNNNYPPYGGNKQIYESLFKPKFKIITLEKAYNSIKPRANNELFIIFEKK